MKLRELISFNLKRIRKEKGLTQASFSELCGISQQAIQHYETMAREPKEDAREKIASALGIEEVELYQLPQSETKEHETPQDNIHILNDLKGLISKYGGEEAQNDPNDLLEVFKRLDSELTKEMVYDLILNAGEEQGILSRDDYDENYKYSKKTYKKLKGL